ncbi:MAG: DUF4199 domain-containing protein, partial [Candidatus Zixiibacteriota bacterium]
IMALCSSDIINFDNGDYFSYSAIVIALSMVFFGVKSYRDNYSKGAIKFGKAFLVGFLISLFASVVWAGVSEFYYQISPESNEMFMNKYFDYQVDKLKASGASQLEIDAKIKGIDGMREMHKSPVYRFVMTIAIIKPIGIIISLLSAAILKKREILPA